MDGTEAKVEGRPVRAAAAARSDPGRLTALILLLFGGYAALTIDVVESGYGIKGDEATYVAMALSAAYDGDLAYEAADVARFFRIYNQGPEGIFLKRGQDVDVGVQASWPFLDVDRGPDPNTNRLYFGKAYIYSVVAAPFVRLAGLNGLLLFHVLLFVAVLLCAYEFLRARSPAGVALPFALGFLAASIAPLYIVWMTSEVFNFAVVFFAYFLWFRKEVMPVTEDRMAGERKGLWSDLGAAVLLGLATYSKPTHVLLIVPPVLWHWWRRRVRRGVLIGSAFVAVVAGAFMVNAMVTGEFNYQGGERRTFYGAFPFERPGVGFDRIGIGVTTNEVVVEERLTVRGFLELLATNLGYFLMGRHFGFVPFFFPGVVAVCLFLSRRAQRQPWQWMILATVIFGAIGLAIYMPYTWSGGGGPSGNRYFLSFYPAFLFLCPPMYTLRPAIAAWVGGTLFTAHILISPFLSAKRPYLSVEHGALRLLPVELTMVNDLPIMLDGPRARVPYGRDPQVLLYFLDHNAYLPEPPGIWVAGSSRADIIVRTAFPLQKLTLTLRAPVANTVTGSAGGPATSVDVKAGVPAIVSLEPDGVYARRSWAYLLRVTTRDGFVPRLIEPGSRDARFLGVAIDIAATAR